MSEKETLGMTEQVAETKELSPSEKAKKKKMKYTMIKLVVVLCAVLCVVLTVFQMSATYRFVKAVEVDGTEYSVAEYNWLYTNNVYETYNTYYQYYGEYAALLAFNPQIGLSEQVQDPDTGKTWAEYFKEYTDDSIVEMTKLYDDGKAAGFELSEESLAAIETEWDSLVAIAQSYGYTANDYAEINYGRGVNEKVFKGMYERYYFAMEYAESVANSYEITAEEIDAHYEENKEEFDTVSYLYYFASGVAAEGEDEQAAMDEAKAEAEAVLADEKEVNFTTNEYYTRANINTLYADWLFDPARTTGEKEIFEGEDGYYVVIFGEANDLHYNTVNVRHILVSPKNADSEKSLEEARELAESYLAEYEAIGTEEAFAELAQKYSVDGSAANGGLYENVFKGQMVAEFEDWCFASNRKPGDTGIVETTYGYHVMYFSGVGEEYYTSTVESALRGSRLNDFIDSLIDGIDVAELMGYKHVGKHFA